MVPVEERKVIAEAFTLSRTGVSEIRDQEIISDGYSDEDLTHITSSVMAEWVGDSADNTFPRLWELTVAKAKSIVYPPVGVMESSDGVITVTAVPEAVETTTVTDTPVVAQTTTVVEEPRKPGRPNKKV